MVIVVGKYRIFLVIVDGSVFIWDGENMKGEELFLIVCVYGIKYVFSLFVGENYLLVVVLLYVLLYMWK